jgi:hypothetical protein
MKRIFLILAILAMTATSYAGDDVYKDRVLSIEAPIRRAVALTPSDTVDLASVPRALWCTDGNITVIFADDTASVLVSGVSGLVPFMIKRLYATGTTSTCTALY